MKEQKLKIGDIVFEEPINLRMGIIQSLLGKDKCVILHLDGRIREVYTEDLINLDNIKEKFISMTKEVLNAEKEKLAFLESLNT